MAYRGNMSFGMGLTPWVQRLLIANLIIYFIAPASSALSSYFMLWPGYVLVRPWTLLTYAFLHGGFFHLFGNMIALFFLGPPLEQRWGSTAFMKYYMLCALGGSILYLVLSPVAPMLGASGAVFGIMYAFARYWPDTPIYIYMVIPVKAKVLIAFLFAMSIVSMFTSGGDGIAHAAHLGGLAAGFIYLQTMQPGGAFGGLRKMLNKRKLKVVSHDEPRSSRGVVSASAPPSARRTRVGEEDKLLDELDRVLEKISTQGMSSLTPAERKLLDEVSRRYRTD